MFNYVLVIVQWGFCKGLSRFFRALQTSRVLHNSIVHSWHEPKPVELCIKSDTKQQYQKSLVSEANRDGTDAESFRCFSLFLPHLRTLA